MKSRSPKERLTASPLPGLTSLGSQMTRLRTRGSRLIHRVAAWCRLP